MDLLVGGPYEDNVDIAGLYAALDEAMDHASLGYLVARNKLVIWDFDAITDSKTLDFIADNMGLYAWDKTWDVATKREKLKIGIQLKRRAGTPYAIKTAPTFILDPDRFDPTNHPIELDERIGSQFYDGTYMYDGEITYNGGYHWTRFRVTIPYDGTPTTAEEEAVEDVINHYKRLVCNLTDVDGIVFVTLQTDYLHFRIGSEGYGEVDHNSALDLATNCSGGLRFWYEGTNGEESPCLIGKGEFSPFGDPTYAEDLVAAYTMEDNAATDTIVDASGNVDAVLKYSGSTSTFHDASGKHNSCLTFPSTNNDRPDISALDTLYSSLFDVGSPFTISGWFYQNTLATYSAIMGSTSSSGAQGFGFNQRGGKIELYFVVDASNYCVLRETGSSLSATTFQNIAWAYLGGDPALPTSHLLLVDGVVKNLVSAASVGTVSSFATSIGVNLLAHPTSTSWNWDGKCDEVYFWNTAKDTTFLQGLYNSGTGRFFGDPPIVPWSIVAPYGSDPTDAKVAFQVNDGTGIAEVVSSNALEANEWNVITWDKISTGVSLIVNGTETTGTLAHNGAANTDPVKIMKSLVNGAFAHGYLADVVLMDSAWDADELATYNSTPGRDGLPSSYVACWRCNEETGTTCEELGGSGMDITLTDAYWDTFLSSWGANSTLSAKVSSYYPCDEDSTVGTVLHDIVGDCHLEGVRATADLSVTGKLGDGVKAERAEDDNYFFCNSPIPDLDLDHAFSFGFWCDITDNLLDRTIFSLFDTDTNRGLLAWIDQYTYSLNVAFYDGATKYWKVRTATGVATGPVFYGFSYDASEALTGLYAFRNGADDSSRSSGVDPVTIANTAQARMFTENSFLSSVIPNLDYIDGIFFCRDHALDEDDFTYIYNQGLGLKWREEE